MAGSRIETLLEYLLDGTNNPEPPQSRIEELLVRIVGRGNGFIKVNAVKDDQWIAAHSRIMINLEPELPEGYEIFAISTYTIEKAASGSGEAHKMVGVQYLATTGGKKIVQMPVINHGDADALFKATACVIACKVG